MSEQEQFEVMLRKMCSAVLREMHPHVVEAEQAGKQARAELRDRFAAAALMGMMGSRNPSSPRFHPEDDAAYVYAVADAMMKSREENSQ